jgi:antitoxin component YwqK of YwqJK toxin-antitoxin module
MQTGAFDHGVQTGTWTRYHENGAIWDTGEYVDGKKSGEWRAWDPDGNLVKTTRHKPRS